MFPDAVIVLFASGRSPSDIAIEKTRITSPRTTLSLHNVSTHVLFLKKPEELVDSNSTRDHGVSFVTSVARHYRTPDIQHLTFLVSTFADFHTIVKGCVLFFCSLTFQ